MPLGTPRTKVFDARFGTVTSLTGPNNLHHHVGIRRLRQKNQKRPGPTGDTPPGRTCCALKPGVPRGRPTASPRYTPFLAPAGYDWKGTYFDNLSREITRIGKGLETTGTYDIWVKTEYDALGRVSRTSRPYFNGATPALEHVDL